MASAMNELLLFLMMSVRLTCELLQYQPNRRIFYLILYDDSGDDCYYHILVSVVIIEYYDIVTFLNILSTMANCYIVKTYSLSTMIYCYVVKHTCSLL